MYRSPLNTFPLKIKAFPLSFSARKINQHHGIMKEFHAYRSITEIKLNSRQRLNKINGKMNVSVTP